MPYLNPTYVGEQDYVVSSGTVALTFTDTPQANDLFVIFVEYQGGDTAPTMTGWTAMTAQSTGSGTAHAACRILTHRYDGSNMPTLTVPDTGNHTSASLHLFRNVDKLTTLSSFPEAGATDATADTSYFGISCTGAASGAATTQNVFAFCGIAAATNHGGASWDYPTDNGDWTKTEVRISGHTTGSSGTHAVVVMKANGAALATQPRVNATNSARDCRVAVYLLGHPYTDYTRAVSDGLTAGDSVGRTGGFTRAISDALQLVSSPARVGAFTRGIADSLGLSDAAARIQGWVRATADSLTLSDTVARIQGFVTGVVDSLTLSDALSVDKILYRLISDALTLADAVARAKGQYRAVVDALTLSDTIKYLKWGIKAVVTAAVASLTSIVTSVKPLTVITNYITKNDYRTQIESTVEPLTDIEPVVAPLTDIEDSISG